MSFDPLTAALDVGKSLIEKIWPDPVRQSEEIRKLQELHQKGDLAVLNAEVQLLLGQINVNAAEAKHKSIFVAGWRPFVGWVCGFGLLYASVIEPLMRFIATVNDYTGTFPILDTTITMQVLIGMLGLGVMRTKEKQDGTHKNSLK